MKLFILIFILISLTSCAKEKSVFWCGDHACINKQEKEDYFKKTMIVEKRIISKKKKIKESEFDTVLRQNKINNTEKKSVKIEENFENINDDEKSLIKENQANEKAKMKQEKKLARQKLKEEKRIARQKLKEEKKLAKDLKKKEKKKTKKLENKDEKLSVDVSVYQKKSSFSNIVKKIQLRNANKPFPNINSNQN